MTAAILALLLAHESSVSSSRLEVRDRELKATFTFSLEDLAGLARLDLDRNGRIEPEEWTRVLPGIFAYIGEKFRVENGDERCRSEGNLQVLPPAVDAGQGRAPLTLELRYRSSRPFDRVSLRCELFGEHGGNPRHIAELPGGRTIVFDKDRSRVDGVTVAPIARAGLFLPLGAGAAALILLLAATARALRSRSIS